MTARTGALWLAGLGLALVASASWLAAAPGLWLLGVAAWLWRRPAPASAAWAVVGGGLAVGVGLGLLLFGSLATGAFVAALGAAARLRRRTALARRASADAPAAGAAFGADEPGHRCRRGDEVVLARIRAGVASARAHRSGSTRCAPRPSAIARAACSTNPSLAHPTPPALEKHALRRVELSGLPSAEEIRFESEFEPRDPEVCERYLDCAPNRNACALLWRHAAGPRPTLIVIHGYGMGRRSLDARAFDVKRAASPARSRHRARDVAAPRLARGEPPFWRGLPRRAPARHERGLRAGDLGPAPARRLAACAGLARARRVRHEPRRLHRGAVRERRARPRVRGAARARGVAAGDPRREPVARAAAPARFDRVERRAARRGVGVARSAAAPAEGRAGGAADPGRPRGPHLHARPGREAVASTGSSRRSTGSRAATSRRSAGARCANASTPISRRRCSPRRG